jgi:hypothetical protein
MRIVATAAIIAIHALLLLILLNHDVSAEIKTLKRNFSFEMECFHTWCKVYE